jgi:hypothetical protein
MSYRSWSDMCGQMQVTLASARRRTTHTRLMDWMNVSVFCSALLGGDNHVIQV